MPKKSTDPFMAALWSALVADKLGPGGQETGWEETPVRVRNRFTRAVRGVLQSGAALQASAFALLAPTSHPAPKRPAAAKASASGKKGRRPDPRELQLPLMRSVHGKAGAAKKGR